MSYTSIGLKVLSGAIMLGIVSCNEPRIIEMEEVH
jgi:hypothetical protein